MGVSKNNGIPKSSILIGFSIIFTIHFGETPLFLETPISGNPLGGFGGFECPLKEAAAAVSRAVLRSAARLSRRTQPTGKPFEASRSTRRKLDS